MAGSATAKVWVYWIGGTTKPLLRHWEETRHTGGKGACGEAPGDMVRVTTTNAEDCGPRSLDHEDPFIRKLSPWATSAEPAPEAGAHNYWATF